MNLQANKKRTACDAGTSYASGKSGEETPQNNNSCRNPKSQGNLQFNTLYNMDCMDGMAQMPDKYFDLAIVDPPYFSGPERRGYYGSRFSKTGVHRDYAVSPKWIIPDKRYFDELFRVCKKYVVWGCNYYDVIFAHGRIVWDKCNGSSSFSDCEIAATNCHESVRAFAYMWNGMMQGKSLREGRTQQGDKSKNEIRIHPTQKPVALYEWLLKNYAKPGDKILDTHVGSASSLIACYNMGFDFMGFELDPDYCRMAQERLDAVMA